MRMGREMEWTTAHESEISRLYGHVTGFYGDIITPTMVTLLTLQVLAVCFVRRKYEEYYGQRSRDFRALTLVVGYVDLLASCAVLASYVRNTGPLLATAGNNTTCDVVYNAIYTTDVTYFGNMLLWVMLCAAIRRMVVSTFFARKEDPIFASRGLAILAIVATVLVDALQAYTNYIRIPLDTSIWVVTYYCKNILARNTNVMMSVMFAGLLIAFIYLNFKQILTPKAPDADGDMAVLETVSPALPDSLQPLWYDEVISMPSTKLACEEKKLELDCLQNNIETCIPPTKAKLPCQTLLVARTSADVCEQSGAERPIPFDQTIQECQERHLPGLPGHVVHTPSPNMPAVAKTNTESPVCCQHRFVSVSALASAGKVSGYHNMALGVLGETLLIFWISSYTVSFYSMPYLKYPAVMAAISFLNMFSVAIFYLGRDRTRIISRIPAYVPSYYI